MFLLILGLVILGPEKLPGAIRKAGRLYGEFRRITSDAQSEFRTAFKEPMQEIQETARGYKQMFTEAASEGLVDEDDDASSTHQPDAGVVPASDHDVAPVDQRDADDEVGS